MPYLKNKGISNGVISFLGKVGHTHTQWGTYWRVSERKSMYLERRRSVVDPVHSECDRSFDIFRRNRLGVARRCVGRDRGIHPLFC